MIPLETLLRVFYANPVEWCGTRNYAQWTTLSFTHCKMVREYLQKNDPNNPYVDKLEECMSRYMKWCHENKRDFPWPRHLVTPAAREVVFGTFTPEE